MTLRFSEQGPLFPAELIDAMLAGDVVILCGTGISAPQLPTFQKLTDQVFDTLGEQRNPSEQLAYGEKRFEEVLGSVARRMADPAAMVRAASAALAVPAEPALDQHKTVLRLSRDLANRILVVTTNFDTLLERALIACDPAADVAAQSFAGQALPAPGAAEFSGIIHIHGRLVDETLDLEGTPLVLTSADYGDAYMRGGWASRFLFDLARCKTILLLGYSAGDAPVRYFLNVLEADRDRFPDLKPVYALSPYTLDEEAARKPWGTVAVTPLPYCEINPETGVPDHSPLWNDLARLADMVERPNAMREARLRAILSEPASTLTDPKLLELNWLLTGGLKLWKAVIETIEDPKWFKVIADNRFWEREDAEWTIAQWIARDFTDRARFLAAIDWQERLGDAFTRKLRGQLDRAVALPPFWRKAWRLLAYVEHKDRLTIEDHDLALQARLGSGLVLEEDIRRAVERIAPSLSLHRPFRGLLDDEAAEDAAQTQGGGASEPKSLAELASIDFGRDFNNDFPELIAALVDLEAHASRVLACASGALVEAVEQAVDLDLVHDDIDASDYAVPSIADHPQNALHGGVLPLVRVIADTFPKVAAANRDEARRIAALWDGMPGRIGKRLTLHAMRLPAAFEADEAMRYLLDLDPTPFWMIRRETALLLAERASAADAALVAAIEQRILQTAAAYFERFTVEEGQPEWRDRARDNLVWLLLNQLDQAGRLSEAGAAELARIKAGRPHLDRAATDRDFFGVYSSGARLVVGDTQPITSAAPQDRLTVVEKQQQSSDIEQRQGWGTYCRADPRGAFDTLAAAPLTPINLDLWDTLLSAISMGDEESKALRDEIALEAFAKLSELPADQLGTIAGSLIDVLLFGPRAALADRENWYDRLWQILAEDMQEAGEENDLVSAALNHPAGRLVSILLQELEASLATDAPLAVRQRARLAVIAAAPHKPGFYGRIRLVYHSAFLQRAAPEIFAEHLLPRLENDEAEARDLRSVFITYAAITPELSQAIPAIILRAIREVRAATDNAVQVAGILLRPALAELQGQQEPQWGITAGDIREILRDVPGVVRKAVLDTLVRWMHADETGAAQAWHTMARPFIEQIWPKGRPFLDEVNDAHLAELAMGAGPDFPSALNVVRPYIVPLSGKRFSLHLFKSSAAPVDFPKQTLDLLWLLFGPTARTGYDMPALLERLIAADASLEIDRRLQSLQQRAERF